jgi:BASS family bile acid:Na+ symporter
VAVRALAPRFALGFERIGRIVSAALFVIVLFGAIYENRDNVIDYFAQAGLVTLALNLAMMALAFFGAVLVGVGRPQRIALSL